MGESTDSPTTLRPQPILNRGTPIWGLSRERHEPRH